MKESRLIGLLASQFDDQTRYNSRIAEANAQQQDAVHQDALGAKQVIGQTTPTDYHPAGEYKSLSSTVNPLLAEARTVYGAQPGQQTVYQNPNNGTIGQAVNIPDGQIALNAFNRLNDSGMSYTDSANRLNDPSYKQGIQQASNTGLQDAINSIPRMITVQAGTDKNGNAIFKQIEDPNYAKNVANTRLSFSQNDANALTKHDQATKAVAASAASQNASKDSAKPGQATATPSPDEARVNAMIQSLPPEYAFLGDAYRAQVAAEGEQKGAAAANYQDATASADASHDGYAKIIDQMASDQKTLYEDSKEFIATAQENRQKAIAEQQALTKEMLAAQEQSQNREMRRNLDKQLNSLVTAQALGGGFGSSNWNAEVSQAAYDGEQAILDMHKEFGFKKVDADIQFTEQMNSVYEFYGQKKLDAMKDYRSTLDQIAQYRFSNEDTTTQRKDKARADYRTTLAGIAKDHAADLKDITKTVVEQITTERRLKQQEELADKRLQYQERMALMRQQASDDRADKRASIQAGRDEDRYRFQEKNQANQKTTTLRKEINDQPYMKAYRDGQTQQQIATDLFTKYQNGEIKNFGDVQEAIGVYYEKMLDPNSIVREGEFNRIAGNTGLKGRAQQVLQYLSGGGRGLSEADVKDLISVMDTARQVRRDTIMTQYLPTYLNSIDEWNATTFYEDGQISPAAVVPPEFLPATDRTSSATDRLINGNYSTDMEVLQSPPPPKVSKVESGDLITANIGGRDIHAQPYLLSALQKADAEMFQTLGQHLQVNESYRDQKRQAKLYEAYQNGTGGRAAAPGKSYHEKGLAVDIQNWEEAAPYLAKYGVVNGLKDDMNHFSIGELNPEVIAYIQKQHESQLASALPYSPYRS